MNSISESSGGEHAGRGVVEAGLVQQEQIEM
jgi:hypothetical protein